MIKGFVIKNGAVILTDREDVATKLREDKEVVEEINLAEASYRIRSLNEKAEAKKKKKKPESDKSGSLNKEKAKVIDMDSYYEAEPYVSPEREIDYTNGKGRKDYVGNINKSVPKVEIIDEKEHIENPIDTDEKEKKEPIIEDVVFDLNRSIFVNADLTILKELSYLTLTSIDNALNSTSIPLPIKMLINTSMTAVLSTFTISSISKWIAFLATVEKILVAVSDESVIILNLVKSLDTLLCAGEGAYHDTDSIKTLYSTTLNKYSTTPDRIRSRAESKSYVKSVMDYTFN